MNFPWTEVRSVADIDSLVSSSYSVPCLIFKHSTRCNISAIAKYRLEDDWNFDPDSLAPFFLDLLAHRNVSNHIAERFDVYHESPQVLIIHKGICIYDASHLSITVEEIEDALKTESVS